MNTFKKGNLVGTLRKVLIEVPCRRNGYKWANRFALVADDGSHLVTETWQSSGKTSKKGEKILLSLGWEKVS